jgi:hypothetical protein
MGIATYERSYSSPLPEETKPRGSSEGGLERSRSSPLPEETKAMWSRRESDSSAPAARRSRVGVGPAWFNASDPIARRKDEAA